jgi:hypothetical protein
LVLVGGVLIGQHVVVVIIGGGGNIHPNTNPLQERQSQSKICGLNKLPLQIITLRREGPLEMAIRFKLLMF